MASHPWFERLPKPIIIAHRGASLDAPENTIAAFELAAVQGAEAIELDVMVCATGEPVVIHDRKVDRTTNGKGEVGGLSLTDLKALDAGSWFDSQYAGERIPSLDDVFRQLRQDTVINIELKNDHAPLDGLPEAVAAVVRERGCQDRIWFSSFNPIALRKIRRLVPETPAGLLLIRGGWGRIIRMLAGWITRYDAVHPEYTDLTGDTVDAFHARGLPVFPYTINDPADLHRAVLMGVDGVITDDPIRAAGVIRSLADPSGPTDN